MSEIKLIDKKYVYVYTSSNKNGVLDVNVFSNLKNVREFLKIGKNLDLKKCLLETIDKGFETSESSDLNDFNCRLDKILVNDNSECYGYSR